MFIPVGSKNPKHLPAQSHATTVEGRALGSCGPGAAAACAGLAAVAANAVVLIWELARMDFLTIRDQRVNW